MAIRPSTVPRSRTLDDLIGDDAVSTRGATGGLISGLEIDSRAVRPGDLFVALRGGDFDGHAYIDQAIVAGAAGVLVETAPESLPVPAIVAPDTRAALAPIAARFYDEPSHDIRTIGITGTDGKTTTTWLIDGMLRDAEQRTGLIGTIGIAIGPDRSYQLPHQTTPESHLVQGFLREMVEYGCDTAILEATSHGLGMHRLDGTRFAIAAVTNVTHEHLEFHKTIEAYRRAKAILLERTAVNGGAAVINADDPGAMAIRSYATGADVLKYSAAGGEADLRAVDVDLGGSGTTFTVDLHGERVAVRSSLIGDFNVANALCAIGVAIKAGVSLASAAASLRRARSVPGRMQQVSAGQPYTVIVDYAHTPESLGKILSLLRSLHAGGRLIVVTGSAGERDPSKRPLQGAVCARLADLAIFANEDPRNEDAEAIIEEIAVGARSAGGVENATFRKIADRRVAIGAALDVARPGDCVLLAGKGHEQSIIVGFEHRPWDEVAVATSALNDRGFRVGRETAR